MISEVSSTDVRPARAPSHNSCKFWAGYKSAPESRGRPDRSLAICRSYARVTRSHGARVRPEVDALVGGVLVDRGELFDTERQVVERGHVRLELGHRRRPAECGGDRGVAQH